MFHYLNEVCPVCQKKFAEGDDIVVCPECGAPHHRACYNQLGHCAHEAEHGRYDWRPLAPAQPEPAPAQPQPESEGGLFPPFFELPFGENGAGGDSPDQPQRPEQAGGQQKPVCPNCGRENQPGSSFCSFCGCPLGQRAPVQPMGVPLLTSFGQPDLIEKEIGDSLYDIPVADWKTAIGQNARFYLMQMYRQKKSGSFLNWPMVSAFLVPEIYFAYRRVWWAAILSGIVELLVSVPMGVVLMTEYGLYSGSFLGLTIESWVTIYNISSIVFLVFRVLLSAIAVWFFRRSSVRRFKKLRAGSRSEDEYQQRLRKQSGPSRIGAYIAGGLMLFSSFWVMLLM